MKKQWISLLVLASFFVGGCQKATSTVTASSVPTSSAASIAPVSSSEISSSLSSSMNVPATGITLDQTTLSIRPDETVTLTATVSPADATDKTVTWSSSDATIATVDAAGVVTGLKPGSITITAAVGEKTATCAVTVLESYPTAVTLDILSASLGIGETYTLTAAVSPATAPQGVAFASDDITIASVSDAGVVKAVGLGTTHITATATSKDKDGNDVSVRAAILVTYSNVGSLTATADKTALYVDETAQITATIQPAAANPAVTYASSDTTIATVSDAGLVTSVAPGEATITVTSVQDSSKKVTIDFTMSSYVTGLNVSPTTLVLDVGMTSQITATVDPETAPQGVTYTSSDETVATVSEKGVVKALKASSTAMTTVKTVGLTASKTSALRSIALTTSSYAPVTGVTVTQASGFSSVNVGTTLALTAAVAPASAKPDVTWTSSDTTIATVSAAGVVTGVALGTATITATSVGFNAEGAVVTGTYGISVDLPAGKVTATADKTTLKVGETAQITAQVFLADGTTLAANQDVYYTATDFGKGPYLSVSATGVVTGVGAGSGMVLVKSKQAPQSAGATINFTVSYDTATSIDAPDYITVAVGASQSFTAHVLPSGADQHVKYSNCYVPNDAYVTSSISSSTTSACTVKGKTDQTTTRLLVTSVANTSLTKFVNVIVASATPTSLTAAIDTDTFSLAAEVVTGQITTTILPSTALQTAKYTSSNTAVATVSSTGLVTAVAIGSADITVTSWDLTCTATVHVQVTA
jgi:uncharacterized protein YjdB